MHRGVVPWLWALLAIGCGAPDPVVRHLELQIALPDAIDCRPADDVTQIRADALGDFPFAAGSTVLLVPAAEPARISGFPPETRVLTLDTRGLATGPLAWEAAGTRSLTGIEGTVPILLLPYGRSCPLGDPQIDAPAGAATAALSDGALLVAGGEGTERRVVVLPSNSQFSERLAVDLAAPRVAASATAVGGTVIVAGGAATVDGEPLASFALYDHDQGTLTPQAGGLVTARRVHGATRLPGGRVLLVGGEGGSGAASVALASAEVIDPAQATSAAVDALPVARSRPEAVTLDDGTVLVLGGLASPTSSTSSPEVFELDPSSGAFTEAAPADASVQPFEQYAAVPLVGARVAWIGAPRDAVSFGPECSDPPHCIRLLHRVPPFLGNAALETVDVQLPPFPLLTEVHGVGLGDGTLLMTGRDPGGTARAFVVDLGLGTLEEVEASRVPTALWPLGDGAVAELSPGGASLRRALLATPYDHPPSTFGAEELAFDALGRWLVVDELHYQATASDARLDVPTARFSDFEVASLSVSGGNADLLLVPNDVDPIAVRILESTVGPPLCEVERVGGAPLRLERHGTEITFSAGGASQTCRIPALLGRVGLAVRADAGAVVGDLKVDRL